MMGHCGILPESVEFGKIADTDHCTQFCSLNRRFPALTLTCEDLTQPPLSRLSSRGLTLRMFSRDLCPNNVNPSSFTNSQALLENQIRPLVIISLWERHLLGSRASLRGFIFLLLFYLISLLFLEGVRWI